MDFPRPVVRIPCFHCRGHKFDPWLRNKDPTCCDVVKQKSLTGDSVNQKQKRASGVR